MKYTFVNSGLVGGLCLFRVFMLLPLPLLMILILILNEAGRLGSDALRGDRRPKYVTIAVSVGR